MLILGINCFHPDAAAALIAEGKLIAAIAEERLNRRKHYGGFPTQAVHECLRMAGADIRDVEHLAVARNPRLHRGKKIRHVLANLPRMVGAATDRLKHLHRVKAAEAYIARSFDIDPSTLTWKVHFVEHHLAHIAGSYLPSGFDQAAGLSVDGSGDFVSAMFCRCEGNQIEILDRVFLPHSLGVFYTAICQFIGYDHYGDEGKVMALAAYGRNVYQREMAQLIRATEGGRYELDLSYFTHHCRTQEIQIDDKGNVALPSLYSARMTELLGPPCRCSGAPSERDVNAAASLQHRFEEVYFHCLRALYLRFRTEKLVLAGGCALNSVANGKIFERTPFRGTYIQPAASDDGTALGAALYVHHGILRRGRRRWTMGDAGTGPEWNEEAIRTTLELADIRFSRLDREGLVEHTAAALERGLVVAWFQGRMEWGPRALGCHSILAHPGREEMKDILNARVKHREWFRPFAPAILEEHLGEYFECRHPSPFMLHVYRIRPEKRDALSAVSHVDHTGRVQTVSRKNQPLFYDLIAAFARRTGTPALLNTSFNENEPIVCRPEEAVECFLRTRVDVLAIGPFFCTKAAAEQDSFRLLSSVAEIAQTAGRAAQPLIQ